MKHIIAAVFVAFTTTLGSSTAVATDLQCWDGTFGYNTMTFLETPDRFELTLSGANVGPLNVDTSSELIRIGRWSRRAILHFPFAKSECTEDVQSHEIRCEKRFSGSAVVNFFIERHVGHLDQSVGVITLAKADKVVAIIQPNKEVTITLDGATWDQKPAPQVIGFAIFHCGNQVPPEFRKGRFPEELEKFLAR
jgi:hypothetical protein